MRIPEATSTPYTVQQQVEPAMTKRPAEDSPDLPSATDSPASKRPRVDEDRPEPTNATGPRWEEDERKGNDIVAAADQEDEQVEEVAGETSDFEEESYAASHATARRNAPIQGYDDLYLDTIDRSALDFDFEKQCSISLSNINVYACLVCGKYFQGRGPKSHAYFHALEEGHHVFVNMETKKVYVLPENYEVKNKSLDDIKYVIDPSFTKDEVVKLDKVVIDAWDLAGKRYRPGRNYIPAIYWKESGSSS